MDMESTGSRRTRSRVGKLLGLGAATVLAVTGIALAATGTAHASTQICSNSTGTESGYYYSLWENGTGSACLTYNGGSYTTSFSSIGDYTAGVGWNPGNTNTVNFTSSVTDSTGTALVSVYGWMTSPLTEYYVEENWSGSTNGTGTNLGTFTMNGGTYTLWEHQQVNQPSISGTATFEQYIAVRNSPTTNSSVNMATVEAAWKAKGLSVGTPNYEIVGSEAYNGGTGSTSITMGGSSSPTPTPTPTASSTPTPTPTSTTSSGGSGTCSVTYTTTNSWTGGYSANVVIKNTGTSALSTWKAGFTYPGDQKMTNDYNGTYTQSGEAVTLTPASYNGSLAAGASTTVGVQGTWTSNDTAPTSFTCS